MKAALLAIAACAAEPPPEQASCASCHTAEAASWRASRHAASFADGAFQTELAQQPSPWCVGCHASSDDRTAGVECSACHIQHGERVTSAACAGCHQFDFPVLDAKGTVLRMTDRPMQDTVAQAAGADCLGCHDPHRIEGSHDAPMRDRALAVTTCVSDGVLSIALANVGAAHNVPTGGVDRHLVLRVWRSSAPDKLVTSTIGRTIEGAADGGKRVASDTTIPPGATHTERVTLASLGGDAREPVNLELVYAFAKDERAAIANTVVSDTMLRTRTADFEPCR